MIDWAPLVSAVPFWQGGEMMRRLMWFTIGFSAACAVGAYAFSAWLWMGVCLGLVFFAAALIFRNRWKMRQVAAVALGISVGLCWFGAYRYFYLLPATKVDGSKLSLSAQVTDYSVFHGYGQSVKAKITIDQRSYRAVLHLNETKELKPGDRVNAIFKLRMTHEGLEGDTYHRGNGIFLLAYAQEKAEFKISAETPIRYFPATMRKAITSRLETIFSEDTAFFTKALMLGDRTDVDYEINTAFKVSGISHIIAVSGLHVSILFSVIFLISGRKRLITLLIGVPVLILFAAITGFTPSVTRACVMQILFMFADSFLKEYDPPTSLSAAVLLMLVCNPVSVTSASLQLSVGCMAGIFLFSQRIRAWICDLRLWRKWNAKTVGGRLRNWLASGVSITLSSMVFTTPLVAYYFGSVSLIGVLTNLLTLWAVSWIFYGAMIACVVSLFWYQGAVALAWVISWLIRYVLSVSKILSAIPLAAVYTKSVFVTAWLVICYILVFVFLLRKNRRPYRLVCSAVISLAIALLLSWVIPMTAKSRVTVLDVGQGQCILLQSKGKTFLVDCGGDHATSAANLAAETLLSMGIYRLDGVILTHYDGDHAGGLPYLLSRIPADNVFLPDRAEKEESKKNIVEAAGDSSVLVQQDIHLSWKETELTVIAPLLQSDDNESGLCVLFRAENCDILITGDLGITGENKLLLEKDIPKLTALIAGHHGSPYSTGEGILLMTKPEYVFISVGADNPYGHPNQKVLDRLEQYNCTVYRTDQDGTIVFRR